MEYAPLGPDSSIALSCGRGTQTGASSFAPELGRTSRFAAGLCWFAPLGRREWECYFSAFSRWAFSFAALRRIFSISFSVNFLAGSSWKGWGPPMSRRAKGFRAWSMRDFSFFWAGVREAKFSILGKLSRFAGSLLTSNQWPLPLRRRLRFYSSMVIRARPTNVQ